MAEIAVAVAASHAPGLIGLFEGAPEESKQVVTDAFGVLKRELHESDLDLLVVLANDHLANSRVRAFPDFLLGMAEEHAGPFEWFKPWIGCDDYVVPGDRDAAETLFGGINERGVRVFATHENLKFDDNISIPTVLCELDAPPAPKMIPILQNCTVPPMPGPERSLEFGRALGDSIREDLPDGMRVGLFGSGGLSHEPGGARYFYIDEEFDHWFLDRLAEGDTERLVAECTLDRMDQAGAGGTTELLAWFDVLGAIGEAPCEVLGYTAYSDWKCGVGAVRWDLS
jgi:Catalytic LigB subunit of aromatic ring-opening dioxygenase